MQRACLSSVRTVDGHAFPLSFLNICNGGIMDRRNVITVGVAIQLGAAVVVATTLSWIVPSTGQLPGKGPIRTVLALGRVSNLIDAPMSLKLSRVSIPAGATALYRGEHSTLFVVAGAATVIVANDQRPLRQD